MKVAIAQKIELYKLLLVLLLADCIADDVEYFGHDLHMVASVASPEQCQALCSGYPGCSFFTFGTDFPPRCWLKRASAVEGRQRNSRRVSGPRSCLGGDSRDNIGGQSRFCFCFVTHRVAVVVALVTASEAIQSICSSTLQQPLYRPIYSDLLLIFAVTPVTTEHLVQKSAVACCR